MEGRGLGTAGLVRSADWIEARLRRLGLSPAFPEGYRQTFRIKTGVAREAGNELNGMPEEDWTPLGVSSSGEFEGELAFVGYGIEAPPIGYQELSGMDLKGKVALMLRYEPQERDEASPFDGRRPSRWSALRYKVHQARERGAAAVVFATGPLQADEKDRLPPLTNDGPESPAGIPVVQVRTSVAQRWLGAGGPDLGEFQRAVDRDLTPRSRASTGVRVRGRVALRAIHSPAQNLAAKIPGKGPLASETIVLGAHYDHLGWGGERSMRPNERAIHNGADDNASGTVAVLLAAERLRELLRGSRNHRTIVFALFSGEEVGLAGSAHFVSSPPVPVERVVAMINLDMVGRLREDRLVAFGSESANEWEPAIRRLARELRLEVSPRGDGYGPSDQTSFYAAKIPVLHFFTGAHAEYHAPEDDPETLNVEGGARIAELSARLTGDIALDRLRPVYARAGAAPALTGDGRGYGSYLGTVPDYRAMEESSGGVLLGDVRPGGPADLAGIRGGDRIVRMAGTRIENLHDMTFALQDHRPGETIEVVVVREGKTLPLRATLGERKGGRDSSSPSASVGAPAGAPPAHSAAAASEAGAARSAAVAEFYEGRPGKDFLPLAGRPFSRTFDQERHLADVRQLTFGGENAEAYFSPEGRRLVYQATLPGGGCDQQYVLDLATGKTRRVSDGLGRTTCGYYDWPEADRIVFASTASGGDACPPVPDRSQGYVWAVRKDFELYEVSPEGSATRRLTQNHSYDAEATWCHRGGKLVFTSDRDGDLDLYEMDEAGNVRRLTDVPGYDGGAFYSPDCSEIVWRASRPEGGELQKYRELLGRGLVRPGRLEIFLMKADGSGARPLTANGAANFCPAFHPDGNRVIYSSNAGSGSPREFELWVLDKQGGASERVTSAPGFDGFPQFSPDGRWLVWSSNRANPTGHETNLFLARWVD
jgi:Tol biopolymer transport system component